MDRTGLHIFPNDPDGPRPDGFVRALHLRRVLPIAESCTIADGELTATSLEIYEDGTILRYFVIANDEIVREHAERNAEMQRLISENDRTAIRRFAETHFTRIPGRNVYMRLEDDFGTTYHGLLRGGEGGDRRFESNYGFTPATPPEAQRLRILLFEGDWRRETGEATKRDPEHLVRAFEVSL